MDCHNRVYVWDVAKGEQLENVLEGSRCAHIIWRARYQRKALKKKEESSKNSISSVVVHSHYIYIAETNKDGTMLFTEVGQYDAQARDWGVDAKGNLWTCLDDGTLAMSTIVEGDTEGDAEQFHVRLVEE